MLMQNRIKKWSKSKRSMLLSVVVLFSAQMALLITSVNQLDNYNDASDQKVVGAYMSGWNYSVCQNDLVQLFMPFLIDFKVSHIWSEDVGQLGCTWRERNNIWRLSIVSMQIMLTIWQFVILVTNTQKKFWTIFYWLQWAFFIAVFVMLCLDSNGLYAGYNACDDNFDFSGYGPIILALLDAEFTTTLPPYFYGPYRPNWQYEQYEDTTIVKWNMQMVDGCYILPWIWVPILEATVVCCTYIEYRIASFYAFEVDEDWESDKQHGILNFGGKKGKNKKKESMAETDGNRISHESNSGKYLDEYMSKYGDDEVKAEPAGMKKEVSL